MAWRTVALTHRCGSDIWLLQIQCSWGNGRDPGSTYQGWAMFRDRRNYWPHLLDHTTWSQNRLTAVKKKVNAYKSRVKQR